MATTDMNTPDTEDLPRYKIGYSSDEWGMNSSLGLIPDANGSVVRHSDAIAAVRAAQAAQPERKPLSDASSYALYAVAQAKWDAKADNFNHWGNLGGNEIALLIAREVEALHGIGEPS